MGKQASAIATAVATGVLLVGGGIALASSSGTPAGDSPEPTVSVVETTVGTTVLTTTTTAAPTAEVPVAPVVPAPVEDAPPPVDTEVVTQPEPQPQPEQPPAERPLDENGDFANPLPPPPAPSVPQPNGAVDLNPEP